MPWRVCAARRARGRRRTAPSAAKAGFPSSIRRPGSRYGRRARGRIDPEPSRPRAIADEDNPPIRPGASRPGRMAMSKMTNSPIPLGPLISLARMPRICRVRKHTRPRALRGRRPQFAVDEIRRPATPGTIRSGHDRSHVEHGERRNPRARATGLARRRWRGNTMERSAAPSVTIPRCARKRQDCKQHNRAGRRARSERIQHDAVVDVPVPDRQRSTPRPPLRLPRCGAPAPGEHRCRHKATRTQLIHRPNETPIG